MERLRAILNGESFKAKESRSRHEISAGEYLASLTEQDRENMENILAFTGDLDQKLPYTRVAVTAVGSTTFPEDQRHHPAEDIDLRILNSSPANSRDREDAILELQDVIRDHLNGQDVKYTEGDHTSQKRLVEAYSGGIKKLVNFIDYDNNDYSFKVRFPEGLPFHISVAGIESFDLDAYLEEERKHNAHFALLYES